MDYAYRLEQDLDYDETLTLSKISMLSTGSGEDERESQLVALYQLITGIGQTTVSQTH